MPAATLEWLEAELVRWQAEGRVDARTAAGIRAEYTASRRVSLGRLLLWLGGAFVGIGLLWLVAANLDELSPVARFALVGVLWLGAVAGAELLAVRRSAGSSDAVVGAARLVAALAYGAVVFQAAQSLQVPAWSSHLLGVWAAGALLYAYATGAVGALLVGLVAGTGWYVWAVTEQTTSSSGVALALLLSAGAATAVAVLHGRWSPRAFAGPWRAAAALLALSGLFGAALPPFGEDATAVPAVVWGGAAVVLLALAAAGAVTAQGTGRLELAAGLAVVVLGWLVLSWQPAPDPGPGPVTGEALARAVVAILVYLLAAVWFAALGVLRGAERLTGVAAAALVVFTVFQSFAVFEPILSGAALLLALGGVLTGVGYLVDRGRRRLVTDLREVAA